MKTTYTWEIQNLDYAVLVENKSKVVTNIHWLLKGTNGEFSGVLYGSWGINFDEKVAFTEFDNLTKDDVLVWLKKSMGDDHIFELKKAIDIQIENQQNPTTGNGLPWVK